jgi:acetate kinase
LWEGRVEWGSDTAAVSVKNVRGAVRRGQLKVSSREQFVSHLLDTMCTGTTSVLASISEIDAVGHRVVHGGPSFEDPVLITPEVHSAIAEVAVLAPLHIAAELEGMKIVEALLGAVPQVAVFDTGFHRRMPLSAVIYPGPYEWFQRGIHRYGFHGINHQYCAERASQMLDRDAHSLKVVTCHLGNGCSIGAIDGGRSVDTTMGFTPLDGLMMGTRSGTVDPGILIYLMREDQLTCQQVDKLLNQESGLLGVSGLSSDLRDILAGIKQGNERARLAFEIFVHRLRKAVGGMAAVLGGLDVLVFTAGMGENSPEVRAATCKGLEFLGLKLDTGLNQQTTLDREISTADSRIRVPVIRAEEDWAIATECWKLAHTSAQTTAAD